MIVHSSNVGAIKIGFKVGVERLSRYVSLYGFGHRVSPDFPGESPGIVWKPEQWTDRALASVSMGYQIAVTPLQVAAAFSSVANGGEYIEPRVLRAVYRDGRRFVITPKVVRRTISADTAVTLTSIMEGVVDEGTGTLARIGGFTVAGKTGTASKLIDGRYSVSENNASFAGFLPSRNPAVTIVVVIDTPRIGGTTGGLVAAPIFKRIAEATLRYLGVGPTINPEPPVLVERRDGANVRASRSAANPPVVTWWRTDLPGTVPDLQGLSGAGRPPENWSGSACRCSLTGDGFVTSQDPPAGAALEPGAVARACPQPIREIRWTDRRAMTWRELSGDLGAGGLVRPQSGSSPAPDLAITGVAYDSRSVEPGHVFVALKGQRADGISVCPPGHRAGSSGRSSPSSLRSTSPPCRDVVVDDARLALARLANGFFRHPSAEMQVVGITGTNGKTTTAYLLSSIFEAAGIRCGMLGTVTYRIGDELREATQNDSRSA